MFRLAEHHDAHGPEVVAQRILGVGRTRAVAEDRRAADRLGSACLQICASIRCVRRDRVAMAPAAGLGARNIKPDAQAVGALILRT